MKHTTAVIAAFLLILTVTSCGGGTSSDNLPLPSSNSSQTIQKIDNSKGYTANMSSEAGLDMEISSVSDIEEKFGTPASTKTYKLLGTECSELTYPFGTLYFEDRNGKQVLTFVIITGKLPMGICGVNIGDDIYKAADALYPGSADKVKMVVQNAKTSSDMHVLFYGGEQNENFVPPYGMFSAIDIEQSSDEGMYTLEYAVNSQVSDITHRIYFTFDIDMKLSQIMINCSELF